MKSWLSLCPDANQLLDGGAEKAESSGQRQGCLGTEALRIEVSGDLPITDCSPPLPAPVLPQALVGQLFLEWDSGLLELGEG